MANAIPAPEAAPSTAEGELFPPEFLARIEALRLLARQLAVGRTRAERKSQHKGISPEFAGYRPYVPGDDTRYIDWNAYARWRHLVLKQFVEERDTPVYLLLDCSPSMDWGSPSKFRLARQLAAALLYIGLGQLDRVGLVPLGAGVPTNTMLPPRRGADRFWAMLDVLRQYRPAARPLPLAEAVRAWQATQPARGLVLWISDFFGATVDDAFLAADRLRYGRHEVGLLQVTDPNEGEPGEVGEYLLECIEGAETRPVRITEEHRRSYRAAYLGYQERLRRYAREQHLPLLQAQTTEPVADILQRLLAEGGFVGR